MLGNLQLTGTETISLLGLAQCVYVLVYMGFRSGDARRAVLPFLYFFVLACAFFFDFAARFISEALPSYDVWQWALWFSGPPLSVLLVLQIAKIHDRPSWKYFWVLLLIPAAYLAARFIVGALGECDGQEQCAAFSDWLVVCGLIAGLISLMAIWFQRRSLDELSRARGPSKERYWLILTIIFANLLFLGLMLLSLGNVLEAGDLVIIRDIMGLCFVYLASTSLFRLYPQALSIRPQGKAAPKGRLSAEDQALISKIDHLLSDDKVYQEPSYGRAELARELGVAEALVSRIVNLHYNKSLPLLLNEYRVEDAKRLLRETDAPINIIAGEVGFNSLASFNRVFRDIAGMSPGAFRSGQEGL